MSYHYVGSYHNPTTLHQGYGSMVGHKLMFAPQDEEHIKALEQACVEHCCKTMGFYAAVCTLLSWKVMDGN